MDTTPAAGLLGIFRAPPVAPALPDFGALLREHKGADQNGALRRDVVECKTIDASQGLMEYVASDQTLDCYQEIVRAAGWKFTSFAKNAPFIDSHARDTIARLLGRVEDQRIEGTQLIETVRWAIDVEECELARFGFKMAQGGYLKAVSVGFKPQKMVWRGYSAEADWQAAVAGLGLDAATAAAVEVIFLEQEQLELSACILGANPNALAKEFSQVVKAHQAGAILDADLEALERAEARRISGSNPRTNSPALATLSNGADARREADVALLGKIRTYLEN